LVATYLHSGLVEYAEPDYRVEVMAVPDDFRYGDGSLWGLHNTGVYGGTPGADIQAQAAWDIQNTAGNIIVAVIDTGVRYTHEDLAGNMWVNPGEIPGNGVDDDGDGYVDDVHGIDAINNGGDPDDDYGHGTHVSGTIGGVGNNSVGVVGVAWQVQIMACKFLDSSGNGFVSDAIKCMDYARSKGARVVNTSWGSPSFNSQALHDAIDSLRQAGIILVAAAGNSADNDDTNPLYPASYDLDNILSVAATTRTDELASFSSYGAGSVDLGAPGAAIFSCWNGSNSDYRYFDGTSMAAPHVSGACALLMAHFPGDNYQQIIQRILSNVDPLPGLAGKCVSGGRLNLEKALGGTAPPPPGKPVVTVMATDANASESGDPGIFTLSRTGDTSGALTVNYSLGGTAVNGTDYQTLSGTVTIAAGASAATVTVSPIDDTQVEGDETVVITLSADAAYDVGTPGSATVTIADNDGTPPPNEPVISLSASDPDGSETGPDSGAIRFHRTGDTSQAIQVSWTFSGTASNGVDYQQLPTTSPFPAGLADADLTITPIDDAEVEGDETVVVTLVAGPGYSVGSPNSAIVTIHDNDQPPPSQPTVTVVAADADASEQGSDPGTFAISRTGSTESALTVNYSLSGTAVNGTDYEPLPASVIIAAGTSSATVTVSPIDDTLVEGDETVVLTVSPDAAYTIGSPANATVTLHDNDAAPPPPPVANFSANPTSGQAPLTVQFTDQSSGSITTRDWNFGDGAAHSSAQNPAHTYNTAGDYTVTLTVTGSGGSNSKSVTIHVTNPPPPPTVTVAATTPLATSLTPGVFTITRTGSTAAALTVNYSLGGTATNGTDYQNLPGSAVIPVGASSTTVVIQPKGLLNLLKTVVLRLSPNSSYTVGSPASATVTIVVSL
jgi:PKD repeat protein